MTVSTLVFIGILVMLLLSFITILFVVLYQQRVMKSKFELEKKEEEYKNQLSLAMIKGEEEERVRIASELHDDVISSLVAMQLSIYNLKRKDENFEQVKLAQSILKDSIGKIRNISHKLHPSIVQNHGFHKAVYMHVDSLNASGTIKICYTSNTAERPNKDAELPLFRIVQELINNIIKHSQADFIEIISSLDHSLFRIHIHHDGTGITDESFYQLKDTSNSIGLQNIYNRISLIKGDISFSINEDGKYQVKILTQA